MLFDAVLAYAHFALILTLASLLFAEVVLYRPTLSRDAFNVLARLDIAYGACAGLVVASGFSRVIWGAKGAQFYLHNPLFWTKIGLFVIVALLSIPPTIHYIRLGRANRAEESISIAMSTYRPMRALLIVECCILLMIPLFAALMARGI